MYIQDKCIERTTHVSITNQLAWRNCNISNFAPGKRKTVITSNWLPAIHSHGILSSTEQAMTFRMKRNAPATNTQSSIFTFHVFWVKTGFWPSCNYFTTNSLLSTPQNPFTPLWQTKEALVTRVISALPPIILFHWIIYVKLLLCFQIYGADIKPKSPKQWSDCPFMLDTLLEIITSSLIPIV